MSSSSVWRPDCRLQPSRLARRAGIALHGMLACLLLTSAMPWGWRIAAGLFLMAHAQLAGSSCFRRGAERLQPCRLRQLPSGWRVSLPDETQTFADLAGPVRDWGFLLCFCLQERSADATPGQSPRRWHLALWRDQLLPDDWRRLRVSLVWRRHADPRQRQRAQPFSKPSGTSTLSQGSSSSSG